jgi:DNA polymerase III subunit epsilon
LFNTTTSRLQAIQTARQVLLAGPVFLDTETTGLGITDEIVEIAIVDAQGIVLVDSFVRPRQPIPPSSTAIHGITDAMVQGAPAWPILWSQIRSYLIGKVLVAYNSDFDLRLMQQSHRVHSLPWKEKLQSFDLMPLYGRFRGVWDSSHRAWKNFRLDEAGRTSGISLPNAHRSLADTLLARELLLYIAQQPA